MGDNGVTYCAGVGNNRALLWFKLFFIMYKFKLNIIIILNGIHKCKGINNITVNLQ